MDVKNSTTQQCQIKKESFTVANNVALVEFEDSDGTDICLESPGDYVCESPENSRGEDIGG